MARHHIGLLLAAWFVACSTGGHGDSETHFLTCNTSADCPSGDRCEANRCVKPASAGLGGATGQRDASAGETSVDGAKDAGLGDALDAASRSFADVEHFQTPPDATSSLDGSAKDAGLLCGAESSWGDETLISPSPWPEQFMGGVGLGVAADGSAFAIYTGSDIPTDIDRGYVSRYSPGKGWQAQELPTHERIQGATVEPQVAVSDNGEALVAWGDPESTDAGARVVTRVLHFGTHWDAPEVLPAPGVGVLGNSAPVGADAHGNFVLPWAAQDGTKFAGVGMSRYARGGVWTTSTAAPPVETDAAAAKLSSRTSIVTEPSGNAMVTWAEGTEGTVGGWARVRRYVKNVGFADAETVADVGRIIGGPQAAIDGDGNAVVLWMDGASGESHVFARVFYQGAWGAPTPLDRVIANGDSARLPRIGTDRAGHFIAVFAATEGGISSIQAVHLTLGSAWSAPVTITKPEDVIVDGSVVSVVPYVPLLAMSTNGTAVVMFETSAPPSQVLSVGAVHYSPGSGWGQPVTPSTHIGQLVPPVIDSCGNATLVWDGLGARSYTARYDAKTGWGAAERLDTGDLSAGGLTALAVGANGEVVSTFGTLANTVEAFQARVRR